LLYRQIEKYSNVLERTVVEKTAAPRDSESRYRGPDGQM
jgi:hypothetical protein